jgi:hypothetical protein
VIEWLLLVVLLGLIPAVIARRKGEGFVTWRIYGSLLFIVALPHVLLQKPNAAAIEQQQIADGMKKSSACAEMIKAEASVCRFCSRAA